MKESCFTSTASESESVQPCRISEVLASEVDAPTDDQAKVELRKLHNNLGHPTNRDLVRILKNAGGSDQAVRLASEFRCDVCHNRQRPAPCLPASAHQLVDFNHRVGTGCQACRRLAREPNCALFECGGLCLGIPTHVSLL